MNDNDGDNDGDHDLVNSLNGLSAQFVPGRLARSRGSGGGFLSHARCIIYWYTQGITVGFELAAGLRLL